MSVREFLASTLALSNTLQHLNAISAKSSLISCVILLNTSTHNTTWYVRKNLKGQVTFHDILT